MFLYVNWFFYCSYIAIINSSVQTVYSSQKNVASIFEDGFVYHNSDTLDPKTNRISKSIFKKNKIITKKAPEKTKLLEQIDSDSEAFVHVEFGTPIIFDLPTSNLQNFSNKPEFFIRQEQASQSNSSYLIIFLGLTLYQLIFILS